MERTMQNIPCLYVPNCWLEYYQVENNRDFYLVLISTSRLDTVLPETNSWTLMQQELCLLNGINMPLNYLVLSLDTFRFFCGYTRGRIRKQHFKVQNN